MTVCVQSFFNMTQVLSLLSLRTAKLRTSYFG